ncbi:hypothetical protein ACFLZZ_03365 [Nanoarchaeota archaeon]
MAKKRKKAKKARKVKKRSVAKKKVSKDSCGGWILAGLLVGIGWGIYVDQVATYTLWGLGAGIVLALLAKAFKKK